MTVDEQKAMILSMVSDFAGEGQDPTDFLDHIGFDWGLISRQRDLVPAILGHYRIKQGVYDIDRAANDLATYPPIASRIVELQIQKQKNQ